MGFPKPLYKQGSINKVGDVSKCVYDKGYLVKEVTDVQLNEKHAFLEFDVIEQVNIEDRAVELKTGSFNIKKKNQIMTNVKLKTTYKPLMTPRWIWRPFEKATARSLHNHVLDKILLDVKMQGQLLKLVETTSYESLSF